MVSAWLRTGACAQAGAAESANARAKWVRRMFGVLSSVLAPVPSRHGRAEQPKVPRAIARGMAAEG